MHRIPGLPVLLLALVPAAASQPAGLIPRSVLFGNPDRVAPRLSPDGTRYAYVAPVDGVLNLWIAPLDSARGEPLTRNTVSGIHDFFWAPDGRSLMTLGDDDGDENYALSAIDAETGERRVLTPTENVQVKILAVSPAVTEFILVEMNDRDPLAHDVYRLDLATGDLARVAENPGRVRFWIPDPQLRVRGMHVSNEDGSFDFLVRDDETAPWRPVAHWDLEDAVTSRPVGFSADGGHAYLLDSRGSDTGRLVELDLATGETVVLAEDSDYDLGDVFFVDLVRHPLTHEPQAVFYDRERHAWKALDAPFGRDLARARTLDRGDLYLESRSTDDRVWFVSFEKDDGPRSYWSFDRDSGRGTFLFDALPALRDAPLARMEPVSFEARDGLEVHGYATFPVGVERRDLPVVVNPHGGPWFRDVWGYHPEVQWLANRGYLVLQVNFRGSTTYGKRFVNAADHEWGRAMLFDLVDAVEWAVDRGWADPERVGILGWSFGGYQALCAAAFAGDTFACAVDAVGPSNLVTFMDSFPPQWETRKPRFHLRGGHPERDADMLRERSPYHHADGIRMPVLVAQGANDPRVKQAESDQIVAALEENGVEHTYLLFEDEGHGFHKPKNRERFYSATERFLARHLGGRVQED